VSAFSQLISTDLVWKLLSVLLLIAINAFFVTAEFSMVTVRRTRIHQLVQAGDIPAIAVEMLQRSIDRLLSTAQLGITLSSLALGWIGENSIVSVVNAWLESWNLPGSLGNFLAHSLSVPITFFLLAYLQIVLGELFPKSVAMLYSEQLSRFLGPSVKAIVRFFSPVIWILNQSTRYLLKLFSIEYTGQSWRPPVTPEELQLIISTERESTGLDISERELLNNVFEFGEITAQDVMTPRTKIITLPENANFQTLLEEMTSKGHSRYPIIGESLDDILGIVYFQDLATPLSMGKMTLETRIAPWMRPSRFVPEQTLLSELLPMMQQEKPAMVIVVNEFGATVGIVTIQDVIAEIIGNAGGRTVIDDLLVQMSEKQTFLVQAQINLEELNEVLHIDLPLAREYQTLGGFLLYQLQRIPNKGEIYTYDNLEFTVVSVIGPRLHQIEIRKLLHKP
jgi:CBS domain containing-hemolysin-like protein